MPKINFPVFPLPKGDIYSEAGLVSVDLRVFDDLNQEGSTLGMRRLQSSQPLLPLKECYIDVQDLVLARPNTIVDNFGFLFTYKKTEFQKVIYHKILKVSYKETVSILKLQGVSAPVFVPRPPPPGVSWVGMLYINGSPWTPYTYSDVHCKDFRKKV